MSHEARQVPSWLIFDVGRKIMERVAYPLVAKFLLMKTSVVIAVFALATVRGEEPRPDSMRQKLHAKVMESLPPPQPAKEVTEKNEREGSVVLMKPVVVSESRRGGDLEAAIARERQKKEDEQFSPTKGGTLYKKDLGKVRAELGAWWADGEGWKFLKFSW